MKKILCFALAVLTVALLATGCTANTASGNDSTPAATAQPAGESTSAPLEIATEQPSAQTTAGA